jgi:hypothetical protein
MYHKNGQASRYSNEGEAGCDNLGEELLSKSTKPFAFFDDGVVTLDLFVWIMFFGHPLSLP